MSPPLELDYIGLAHFSSADKLSSAVGENLRETELRLGLPGSQSPNRKEKLGLTLGLQLSKGYASGAKRGFSDAIDGSKNWGFSVGAGGSDAEMETGGALFSPRAGGGQAAVAGHVKVAPEKKPQGPPNAKAQVVGWPPIRSYRKNSMATNPPKKNEDDERKQGFGCPYIKVSMDGAPYLRKVDLGNYCSYKELSSALEKMFSGFTMGHCGANGIPSRDGLSERCLIDLLSGSECVLAYEDKDGDWMLVGDVPWEMFIDSCKRLRIMKGSEAIGLAPRVMEKNRDRK